jgi:hypothetical protein
MEEVTMAQESRLTERQRFWLEHLRACGSGSLKAYAQTHGLDLRALYDAKARLKRKGALPAGAPARLVRVERAHHRSGDPAYCRVHLANGVAVELSCAPEHWARLFASVATLP